MNHIECDHYAALLYDRLLKSNHDRTALLDDVDKSRRLLRASQGFEAELRAALTQADALGYTRGRDEAFRDAAQLAASALAQGAKGAEIIAVLHLEARALTAEPAKEEK